jgi:very-short-patch-repair endonuclease
MSHTARIRQLLADKPGLKAQQIAAELGLDRPQVVATLHSLAASEITQDNAYRWWPKAQPSSASQSAAPAPQTLLASICRYYLECLARESGSGISLPASDSAGYVELGELPFARDRHELPATDRALKRLVQKVRRERGQLTLYVGYAILLRTIVGRNQEERRIEPVLLYPIEDTPPDSPEPLRPLSAVPLFNLDVLKSLPAADSGNLMDEAIHLSEELGLANTDDDLPQWDEIILRLQGCRPEWSWRENLDPYALSTGAALADLSAPGIYNRAVLFAGTRSPFTYGLEIELRKLMQLDDAAIHGTALGLWLRGETPDAPPGEEESILEALPLNTEQRQAVLQAMSAPLTVVTGPPGTGKSQVVTSLLANQAWQGKSVLFSSKNNHAVDVVESRVNDLGPVPLLLRLGREEHHARIAQHLTAALAESSPADAAARCAWLARAHEQDRARFAGVQREIASAVSLRNAVDELERAAEPARALFGPEQFATLRSADVDTMRWRLEALTAALERAEAAPPAMARLLGDSARGRNFQRLGEISLELRPDADLLGLALPGSQPGEHNLDLWKDFRDALAGRLEWAARVRNYGQALERLRAAPPLESMACGLTRIAEESAHTSLELWQTWLRLWPSRWDPEQRKLLSEYVSLLQMVAAGDRYDEGAGRRVFRRYYSLFPKVTKILPCWAVTSLSARGRLPFEPGIFDLLVIDEASQCDIASALPLLYRARRAAIIGDPLQLKHVSTVAPQQDRLLLAAHGLAEGHAPWAYSVNSLFDLARSLCRYEDIVSLRDHHRSHRDIIGFSNRHFYHGGLRIATDHGRLKRPDGGGPAVRWVDLRGKVVRPSGGGALNAVEAEAVVVEVRKLVVEQGYNGAIGVVTPFRAQANRIRTLVHQDPELSRQLASLQFIVDTVHGYQGDERDVIFFSPVVSLGVGESTLRFLKTHGNLFNVAITRARSLLVVVGDRQAALDSRVSYLASFAAYSRDLAQQDRPPAASEPGSEYPAVAHPELVSEWERVFYRAMRAAGLQPVPQYEEAPYTLDFALFHGDRKLDIEVDGEHYHRNWDGELCRRDQIRSRRLHDMDWSVMRFWVYEIRDDLQNSVGRVSAWLNGNTIDSR